MGISSIIIDSREPEWIQKMNFGTPLAAVAMLDAGDLFIATDSGEMLIVERKTASDFLNTLRDDRLFPQMLRLVETTPWAYLAICGQLQPGPNGKALADGRETGWSWASVQGAMLSIQEMGVHILSVASDHDYEQSIIRLANRDRKAINVKPARDATLTGEGEIIIGSLPGIGPERAHEIIKYCTSPGWALSILTDDEGFNNVKIPGIGDATKKRIRKALQLKDDQVLVVHLKEKS